MNGLVARFGTFELMTVVSHNRSALDYRSLISDALYSCPFLKTKKTKQRNKQKNITDARLCLMTRRPKGGPLVHSSGSPWSVLKGQRSNKLTVMSQAMYVLLRAYGLVTGQGFLSW